MPVKGRLGIVVGHTKLSGGAMGKPPISTSEYVFNTGLAGLIKQVGESRGHEVSIFFRDVGNIVGAYKLVKEWQPEVCIELHFNASNGTVRGSETWYLDLNKEDHVMEEEFAQLVQDHICVVFGRGKGPKEGNRGIKEPAKEDRGYFNLSQISQIPSILIEPFFGDNLDEAKLAVDKKQALAEAIIQAFEDWEGLPGNN
jgi:N-acetylmuramoyl-L-alanine amidase